MALPKHKTRVFTYVLRCQEFLTPEETECRNQPTLNPWLTHPQCPCVHQLQQRTETKSKPDKLHKKLKISKNTENLL